MSTVTSPGRAGTAPALPGTAASVRPRFLDLVGAEWIKFRSLRSTWWTLLVAILVPWGAAAAAAMADYDNWPNYGPLEKAAPHLFAVHDSWPLEGYVVVMLAAGALGALAMAGEYGSGLIRTTTVAVPARGSVVLAKAVVQAAVWTAAGWVCALGSYAIAQGILSGRHATIALGYAGVPRALVAAATVAPVCALVGLGIGTLVRHAGGTIGILAFVVLLLPQFFSQTKQWSADVRHVFPVSAFGRLTEVWTASERPGFYPATITGSWLDYLVWPLAAVLLAVWVVRRRDV
ncbi:ABC transporter permease subunit [Streptacidiphilus neutrinimicus]|uniref:ABC transporter permease subunit n=1 Tax=Streptacidiphilus neutrinimicus TaxID=105420 RepID=UPI0006942857|nr:ABC transporter permease subunit [Streptacidiphilus neutrinimicus]